MAHNVADPKKIEEQGVKARHVADQEAHDLRFIMSDVRGRRFLDKLLDFCGPLRTPFNTNGSVANFNMGQANVGLKLLAEIESVCPDLYLVMRNESRRKEESNG